MTRQAEKNILSPKAPVAYKTALYMIAVSIITGIAFFVIANYTKDNFYYAAGVGSFVLTILTIFSAVQIRNNKVNLGILILCGYLGLALPLLGLKFAGAGLIGGLFSLLLIAYIAYTSIDSTRHLIIALIIAGLSGTAFVVLNSLQLIEQRITIPTNTSLIILGLGLGIVAILLLAQRFYNLPLRVKLLIMFAIVSMMPVTILGYFAYNNARQSLVESAEQQLTSRAEELSREITDFFETTARSLESETRLPSIKALAEAPEEHRDAFLRSNAYATLAILESKDSKYILSYAILDRSGLPIVVYPPLSEPNRTYLGLDIAHQNNLKNTMLTGLPYSTPVLFNQDTGEAGFYFATRIATDAGIPVGLLIVHYDGAILQEFSQQEQDKHPGSSYYNLIVNDDNIIIAHSTQPELNYHHIGTLDNQKYQVLSQASRIPSASPEQLSIENWTELATLLQSEVPEGTVTLQGITVPGESDFVAMHKVPSRPWKVLYIQPQQAFFEPITSQIQTALSLIIGIGVFVILGALWAAQTISSPISILSNIVEEVGKGQLDRRVPIETQDEIGRLAQTFNQMTEQLRNLLGSLEQQVEDRTKQLERRANQLRVAAEVAKDASSLRSLPELLNHTVDLITNRFGFYHAGIFLLDDNKEYAVFVASNSIGGKQMLARNHRLKVGSEGIVGYSTATGEPRIALDVGEDAYHFRNPYLPETRSEMCVPLKVGGEIIGALDIQSKREAAFDEQDLAIMEVVADQLAIAIQNLRLIENLQNTLSELELALGQYTKQSWSEYLRKRKHISGMVYHHLGIEPITTLGETEMRIIRDGRPLIINRSMVTSADTQLSTLYMPIQLRQATIGVLEMKFDLDIVPEHFINISQSIAERLAYALDNARLLEQTHQRAQREQLLREIGTQMMETLDMQTILRIASEQIRLSLDLPEVTIRLGSPESPPETDDNGYHKSHDTSPLNSDTPEANS